MVGKNIIDYFSKKSNFKLLYPDSKSLNLLDSNAIENYLGNNNVDCIIHCAGLVGGIQANINSPYSFLETNLLIGLNLINSAVKFKIGKFINLGSSCMYPKDRDTQLKESDILTGPLEPTNEGYAIAKITVAKLCEYANNQFSLNYKTIIPCNIYGKWDKFDPIKSHLIPAVIRKINQAKYNNEDVKIWGDGKARREFLYAEDLADFILFSLNNYKSLEDYTNVGLGYDYSILEYYKIIAKVTKYNGKFRFDLSKPSGMKRKLCSINKQTKLGWSPKHSLEEGISKTNKFFIENYGI